MVKAEYANHYNTPWVMEFIMRILEGSAANDPQADLVNSMFLNFANHISLSFSLAPRGAELAYNNRCCVFTGGFGVPIIDNYFNHDRANFLLCCQKRGLELVLERTVAKIVSEAATPAIEFDVFVGIYLPMLKTLIGLLPAQARPNGTFCTLVRGILSTYVLRFIPTEPDWTLCSVLSSILCQCRDCGPLKRFLLSSTDRSMIFEMPERRRKHLEKTMSDSRLGCETKIQASERG
jgi:hypothetical protein